MVKEEFKDTNDCIICKPSLLNLFFPKYTPKGNFHKIIGIKESWALSIRGPWDDTWKEFKNGEEYTLSKGRVRVK